MTDRELTLVDAPVDEFELKIRLEVARDAALSLAERLALSVKDRPGSAPATVGLADLVALQMRVVHSLRREIRPGGRRMSERDFGGDRGAVARVNAKETT